MLIHLMWVGSIDRLVNSNSIGFFDDTLRSFHIHHITVFIHTVNISFIMGVQRKVKLPETDVVMEEGDARAHFKVGQTKITPKMGDATRGYVLRQTNLCKHIEISIVFDLKVL